MSQVSKSVILLILVGLLASEGFGQVSILTQHNDTSRTGQNLQETVLNTSSVNVSNFGKLFSLPVTGNIFAQPLYIPGLTIGGATHNVVYVVTAANNVYAFDADSGNANPLWTVNLGTPVPSQDICVTDPVECPYTDVIPVIGILATPVIDPVSKTIYVVANTKDNAGNYHFKLHALNLTTGAEKFGGPTEITATGFTPLTELCRPGMLLANGTVYMAFGSVGDFPTWHGFVIGYNASTLQQTAVYNSTPQHNDVGGAGIWLTGNGLVADSTGNVYAVTSNGNFDVNTGGKDYGSAYLKLSGSTLSVLDYFVPYNQAQMNPEEDNVDLGSGGPLLIPNTTLLVGGGKDAVLRVVDTTNMGEYNPSQNNNHQNLIGATNPPIFGSPVYWNSPNLGPLIYMWGQNDFAKAWSYNSGTKLLSTTPAMESSVVGTKGWNDQSALSISASGSASGTGILWASMPYSGISNPGPVPGILYALDATNLGTVLWNSQLNSNRDAVGNYAKFVPPTVVNGKVYLATFSGEVVVYGLNPPPSNQISFVQVNAATPQSAVSSVTVPFKAAQSAGDLNVVVVGWNDTTTTVQSVSDNLGNQYVLAAGPTKGTGLTQSIYYAKDILGGSNSVIVTFSKAASYPDVRVLEYYGADPANPLDVVASASGNSASANSGSATTSSTNELIFGANTVATGNLAPGSGFTLRILTSPDSDLAEDRSVTTTGSYNATATLSASGPWVMQMVALKASVLGGSAPTITSISPNSGSTNGGTAVTITGTNFVSGATVTFGGTPATNVTVVSSTSITATTPAHAAGAVNVVVSDSGGSGTLTNGFTYIANASIGFVQVASATPQSPTATVKVTYPQTQTAGDLNLVAVGWNDTSATVQSVTDSLGNSYALAAGPVKGTALTQSIYYAKNIAPGSNSVTVTFTKVAVFPDVRILEYKGLNTTAPLDVTAGASGTSGNNAIVSSGAATTTSANELIFGAGMTNGAFTKAGTSFKAEVITADGDIAEDQVVSATGSYSATASLGAYGSQQWVMQMVTFKQ
jgi:IPT/TIG domain